MQAGRTLEAPVSEVHSSLSATKADLDRIYRELETVVPMLQRHLQDPEVNAEGELTHFLHKIWSVARDVRDGMRVTRDLAGIRT